uniref:(California timema) hypothetical protein n=1 Tax=Timema californicum TaxID=61474 RepID=A0A7R9P6K8_TIMCA|nr:unnamed protein product [Timema californicum]
MPVVCSFHVQTDEHYITCDITGSARLLALEYGGSLFCGSSAIGDYWVLTAGHCLYFFKAEDIKVRAGSLQQNQNGTLHEVAELISHPKFDMSLDVDNDIGLIKLKDPLSSNPYVKYVGLPDQGEPTPIGSRLVVAGWGCTKPYMEGGTSPVLKKAYADVLEPTKCEEHPMMTGTHVVSNNMICAMQEGHTAYKGDSGGPLFDQKDGKVKQIGIVSWGDYLGHQSIPTVYAKVSQFRLWIFLKTNI